MTADQSRAARSLLKLKQGDLAALSGISALTIRCFERQTRATMCANMRILRQTLEQAGIIFLEADAEGGPGVRLRVEAQPARHQSQEIA